MPQITLGYSKTALQKICPRQTRYCISLLLIADFNLPKVGRSGSISLSETTQCGKRYVNFLTLTNTLYTEQVIILLAKVNNILDLCLTKLGISSIIWKWRQRNSRITVQYNWSCRNQQTRNLWETPYIYPI